MKRLQLVLTDALDAALRHAAAKRDIAIGPLIESILRRDRRIVEAASELGIELPKERSVVRGRPKKEKP